MALNTTTPGNIPAEFTDQLSGELLLQPDADFVFARSAYSALVGAQMAGEDGFDLAVQQLRDGRLATSGLPSNVDEAMSMGMGGPLLVSMGMVYPDMVKIVKEARQPGEVIQIDKPVFVDGATTEASRKLGAQSTIFGSNSQAVSMGQVDVTIVEYGGPGDASGAIVPLSLARFTQHRAAHDLLKVVGNNLRRDRYKFVDDLIIARALAAASANDLGTASGSGITRGGNVASNAAFTGNNNEPFTFDLLVRTSAAMDTRKVPGIGAGRQRVAFLDQDQYADLMLDPMYQRQSWVNDAYSVLFPGYKKSIENFVICVSNRMPRLTNLGAGANLTGKQALVVSPNFLGWACAMDAMAIRDRNDDGGRFARYAWNAYEGWQILDDRFVQAIITT